jgi:hypothetical protein
MAMAYMKYSVVLVLSMAIISSALLSVWLKYLINIGVNLRIVIPSYRGLLEDSKVKTDFILFYLDLKRFSYAFFS